VADLFDEFMKELRRRQAEATGRPAPLENRPTRSDRPAADAPGGDGPELDPSELPADRQVGDDPAATVPSRTATIARTRLVPCAEIRRGRARAREALDPRFGRSAPSMVDPACAAG